MWDEDGINSKNISDNVVDFMVGKILKLSMKRQNMLKIAACIGSCFADIIMPWIGFGTYHLKQKNVYDCTLEAIKVGYCCIDMAFIYGGETTESEVGFVMFYLSSIDCLIIALLDDILSKVELVILDETITIKIVTNNDKGNHDKTKDILFMMPYMTKHCTIILISFLLPNIGVSIMVVMWC